jgi:hypothetical protein
MIAMSKILPPIATPIRTP